MDKLPFLPDPIYLPQLGPIIQPLLKAHIMLRIGSESEVSFKLQALMVRNSLAQRILYLVILYHMRRG